MYAKRKGTGVGGRVLSFLEARAREMGYSALWLETGTVNDKAVSFYETNGYHVIPNFGAYAGRTDSVCFEKNLGCSR
jgi:ribosomal protein S18 acetylase RimI-like enzyme